MSELIFTEIPFATPAFDEALGLRNAVLRVPLGREFYADDIAREYDQTHLGVYAPSWELLGCLTLKPLDESTLKMRQVAVTERQRGRGLGRALVHYSERWAQQRGYTDMTLHAREVAVPFYLKMNYQTEGDRFEEVGIPHFRMRRRLK